MPIPVGTKSINPHCQECQFHNTDECGTDIVRFMNGDFCYLVCDGEWHYFGREVFIMLSHYKVVS